MTWAKDLDPGGDDTFRLKIWYDVDGNEQLVYDNGIDQPIGGGNIKIHGSNGLTAKASSRPASTGVALTQLSAQSNAVAFATHIATYPQAGSGLDAESSVCQESRLRLKKRGNSHVDPFEDLGISNT